MDEREFELINIIGGEIGANQRDLSRQMNLSLGMTNMLVRRLLTKGYIRIRQLNKKKMEYILTPKGFMEKTRKSVNYTLKTINSIGLLKQSIAALLRTAYDQGARKFYLLGGSDLSGLVDMAARENFGSDCEVVHAQELSLSMDDGVVLICREDVSLDGFESLKMVNVVEELAKDYTLVGQALAVA